MGFLPPNSPMKRTEAPTAMDQDDIQSPSAKRRSVHGAGGLDFSIFESDSLSNSLHEKRWQDDNDWLRQGSPAPSSRFSTIPKRTSSLRKSTVQQRQSDQNSQLKFNEPLELNSSWFEATPAAKNSKGLRMSLDNHIDPLPRDSPFAAQGNLLSASIHPANSVHHSQATQTQQARHPLSRTMTQSSSTSSIQDDSPTHEPVHRPTRPRSYDFSKSLPIGAGRPSPAETGSEFSSQGSFATPGNYKSARPLPAAFMSTGLISKKNRNVEDPNGACLKLTCLTHLARNSLQCSRFLPNSILENLLSAMFQGSRSGRLRAQASMLTPASASLLCIRSVGAWDCSGQTLKVQLNAQG